MTRELAQLDLFGGPEIDLRTRDNPLDRSHLAQLYRWLKAGRMITSEEALERFGCSRLPARIYDLRVLMHCSVTTRRELRDGRWVTVYRFA